jgi:hypothetical protein
MPLLERGFYAAKYGLERYVRIFPTFDQSPIERRHQKQAGTASPLEMLLDLSKVVEVVPLL